MTDEPQLEVIVLGWDGTANHKFIPNTIAALELEVGGNTRLLRLCGRWRYGSAMGAVINAGDATLSLPLNPYSNDLLCSPYQAEQDRPILGNAVMVSVQGGQEGPQVASLTVEDQDFVADRFSTLGVTHRFDAGISLSVFRVGVLNV